MGLIGDLPLAAADVLWEDLKLGDIPFPLEVPRHGDTAEERARIRAAVYVELKRRGLATADRPTAELADTLRLLAVPKIGIDLVALPEMSAAGPITAVVCARGKLAVLAVQGELVLTLTEVSDTAIVGSIVDLLPANHAGPGQPVTVPAAVLVEQPLGGGRHRRPEPGVSPGDHRDELEVVARTLARPTVRAGAIGIVLRDEAGELERLPGVGFFDTDEGRYLTTVELGPDGEDWVALTPADNQRLAHHLTETLVNALRSQQAVPTPEVRAT